MVNFLHLLIKYHKTIIFMYFTMFLLFYFICNCKVYNYLM